MRAGTTKAYFFRLQDLPEPRRRPEPPRDNLLLRVIGSPDPYGKQTDGYGRAATFHTSKPSFWQKAPSQSMTSTTLFGQVLEFDTAFCRFGA